MGAKKAANLFRIYCFVCRCGVAIIQFSENPSPATLANNKILTMTELNNQFINPADGEAVDYLIIDTIRYIIIPTEQIIKNTPPIRINTKYSSVGSPFFTVNKFSIFHNILG